MSRNFEQDLEQEILKDIHAATEAALKADREAALRDVFAAAALSGIVVCHHKDGFVDRHQCARMAFDYADAMLACRRTNAS